MGVVAGLGILEEEVEVVRGDDTPVDTVVVVPVLLSILEAPISVLVLGE